MLCTASHIFELYSDLLIIWVSLYSSVPFTFGLFAVLFPILNRIMQLFVCSTTFINGMKMRRKTISSEKIDILLIYLSLYNMSRLMFPAFNDYSPRVLIAITVKECVLKLIQIILKLILISSSLPSECIGNTTILTLMIIGNLLSFIQMIFFMTDRLT